MNPNLPPDPQPDDLWSVDRLLDPSSPSAPSEPGSEPAGDLAAVVDALRAPAADHELAGQATYLAAYDEALGVPATERKNVRTIVIGSRAAVVAAIAVVGLAGAAAAYTGSLPGALQSAAHRAIGAPRGDDPTGTPTGSPSETPTGTGTATDTSTEGPTGSPTSRVGGVGPVATGPAAFGLCTAWSRGGLAVTSTAYRNLATAAGGADGIAAYCATILPTSTRTHGTGSPTSHPGGSPTSHPGGGSPTSHPHGSPTTHPGGGSGL